MTKTTNKLGFTEYHTDDGELYISVAKRILFNFESIAKDPIEVTRLIQVLKDIRDDMEDQQEELEREGWFDG